MTVWTSSATTRTSAPSALWAAILLEGTFTTGVLQMERESRFSWDWIFFDTDPLSSNSATWELRTTEWSCRMLTRNIVSTRCPCEEHHLVSKLSSKYIWSVAVGRSSVWSRGSAVYGSHNCRHGLDHNLSSSCSYSSQLIIPQRHHDWTDHEQLHHLHSLTFFLGWSGWRGKWSPAWYCSQGSKT